MAFEHIARLAGRVLIRVAGNVPDIATGVSVAKCAAPHSPPTVGEKRGPKDRSATDTGMPRTEPHGSEEKTPDGNEPWEEVRVRQPSG